MSERSERYKHPAINQTIRFPTNIAIAESKCQFKKLADNNKILIHLCNMRMWKVANTNFAIARKAT